MIRVTEIKMVPGSTIAYGKGVDEHGDERRFVGDHRQMFEIREALADGEPVFVEPPAWAMGWGH